MPKTNHGRGEAETGTNGNSGAFLRRDQRDRPVDFDRQPAQQKIGAFHGMERVRYRDRGKIGEQHPLPSPGNSRTARNARQPGSHKITAAIVQDPHLAVALLAELGYQTEKPRQPVVRTRLAAHPQHLGNLGQAGQQLVGKRTGLGQDRNPPFRLVTGDRPQVGKVPDHVTNPGKRLDDQHSATIVRLIHRPRIQPHVAMPRCASTSRSGGREHRHLMRTVGMGLPAGPAGQIARRRRR